MMSSKKTNKNKAFPESLKTALHNHFCRMNTIIHLPTEEGHVSNQFEDFLDDVDPYWVLAQSIQHAAGQSIELARQLNREHEQKNRKEFLNKIGAYANAFN